MRILVPLLFAVSATAAWGGMADTCVYAVQSGDLVRARHLATVLLSSPSGLPNDEAQAVMKCVKMMTGQDYTYDPKTRLLSPPQSEYGPLTELAGRIAEAAQEGHLRAERDRERKAQERAKAEAAAKEEAEESARLAQMRAEGELIRLQRQRSVQERLSEGCSRMYRRDPDATITNSLCYEVFFNQGLPE